ncbi:MAG TPA: GNAT family N-acetyltransferase [Elusimicrobiales bacterium]|nr:GNAT family N-acetyltransferase [Elusimicrobiales bacterium]
MVRKAVVADAQRIAEIHISGWRTAYRGILTDAFLFDKLNVERRAKNLQKELADGAQEHYVAERDGQVSAFMAIGESRDEDKRGAGSLELIAIYVDPKLKRSGLGHELLEFLESEARRRGYKEVSLWVLDLNAAGRSFYEKNGYSRDGAIKTLERLCSPNGAPVEEVRYIKAMDK